MSLIELAEREPMHPALVAAISHTRARIAAAFSGRRYPAALSALKLPHAGDDGWQDIATFAEPTALSSGNGVLVADKDGTVGEAYCRNYGDKDDGWWWANTSWGDYPEPDRPRPTHWRPLPTPPAGVSDNV